MGSALKNTQAQGNGSLDQDKCRCAANKDPQRETGPKQPQKGAVKDVVKGTNRA